VSSESLALTSDGEKDTSVAEGEDEHRQHVRPEKEEHRIFLSFAHENIESYALVSISLCTGYTLISTDFNTMGPIAVYSRF